MKTFFIMLKRNVKLFFKDKGLFFTSLITPLILLVLYATFLFNVYKSSFVSILDAFNVSVSDKLLSGMVAGQLMSSLLAVSCVTVSFCSNMLMVQDKVSGAHKDMLITPISRSKMALSYYLATTINTLIICLFALGLCLVYVATVGWYLSFKDVLMLVLDILLLTSFGTALSSVINYFLSSQGQISAVGSIVSSCYGFICGAYMPLSSFSEGIRKAVMFLPGTYGTSLLRNHAMNGAFNEMHSQGISTEVIDGLKVGVDCKLEFFGRDVKVLTMFLIMAITVILLICAYVLINVLSVRKKKTSK